MKIRFKRNGVEGAASRFNVHAASEVITYTDEDCDSTYIKDLDVFIEGVGWKDMHAAFRDKDIITDNYNVDFGPPPTPEDRERGYWL